MNIRPGLRVITPHRYAAISATPHRLALAARARQYRSFRFTLCQFDLRRLDDGVDRDGRSGLALAPCAMTAVHDDWPRLKAIAHRAAGATAFWNTLVAHCRLPS